MAALLAVACGVTNPKSQRIARFGTTEDAKKVETLPTIRLALDVRGGSIGLVGAGTGPMCDGPITGSLLIRAPGGGAERMSVQVAKLSARACVGCDPVPGDPHSCDDACRSEYLPWIEVGRHAFADSGDYAISGDELRLGCAPDRFRVEPVYVATDGNGVTQRIPALRSAVPTPAVSAPPATTSGEGARETASEIRLRFARPSSPLTEKIEGLALPVGPHQPELGASATH